MTQKKFAEQIDISPSALSNILSGKRRPSYKMAKRLAAFTGTQWDIWMEQNLAAMQEAIEEVLQRRTLE